MQSHNFQFLILSLVHLPAAITNRGLCTGTKHLFTFTLILIRQFAEYFITIKNS